MATERKKIASLLPNSQFQTLTHLISYFQNKQSANYFYKPIGVEIEITNICNLKCRGCGLIIDDHNLPKDTLSDDDFEVFLKECARCNMFGYSVTGGEPFLKFSLVEKLIKSGQGLDLYKLNTNGTYFKTKTITKDYLKRLKRAGFGEKNKYIKPVLVLSMGHQNVAGTPIINAVHLTSQFYSIFNKETALCSINITEKNPLLAKKIYNDFKKLYFKITKKPFDETMFIVRFFSLNYVPTLKRLGLLQGPKVPIAQRIEEFKSEYISKGCFNIQINNTETEEEAETLTPRCVLRPNGDIYACPGYNRTHKIGNIQKNDLHSILQNTNNDTVLKTVFTKNLEGLYELVLSKTKNIAQLSVEKGYGPCDICEILSKEIRKNHISINSNVPTIL